MLLEDVMAIEQSIIQSEKIVWWWPLYDITTSQDHKDDTRSRGDVMIVWGVDDLHLVCCQFVWHYYVGIIFICQEVLDIKSY